MKILGSSAVWLMVLLSAGAGAYADSFDACDNPNVFEIGQSCTYISPLNATHIVTYKSWVSERRPVIEVDNVSYTADVGSNMEFISSNRESMIIKIANMTNDSKPKLIVSFPQARNNSCIDTDWFGSGDASNLKRLSIRGTCTDGDGAHADVCDGDNALIDYYCEPLMQDPKHCGYATYFCKASGFSGCRDGVCVMDKTNASSCGNGICESGESASCPDCNADYYVVLKEDLIEDMGSKWKLYDHDTNGTGPYNSIRNIVYKVTKNRVKTVKFNMGGSDWRALNAYVSPDGRNWGTASKSVCCYGSGPYSFTAPPYSPFYVRFEFGTGSCCEEASYVTLDKVLLLQMTAEACSDKKEINDCLDMSSCYWDQETDSCRVFDSTKQYCSDPDNGKDLSVQAHTFGFRADASGERDARIRTGGKDACVSGYLREHYCDGSYNVESVNIECPDGYVCRDGACVSDQKPSDWDYSMIVDRADAGPFFVFSNGLAGAGMAFYGKFNGEDNLYVDVPYHETCPPGWRGDPAARRAKGWYAERKKISDDMYKILIRGTAPADCDYHLSGYAKGELSFNPSGGWMVTDVVKCSAQASNKGQETYCTTGDKFVRFAAGSNCGGCCACADSGSVDIEVVVERNGGGCGGESCAGDDKEIEDIQKAIDGALNFVEDKILKIAEFLWSI